MTLEQAVRHMNDGGVAEFEGVRFMIDKDRDVLTFVDFDKDALFNGYMIKPVWTKESEKNDTK